MQVFSKDCVITLDVAQETRIIYFLVGLHFGFFLCIFCNKPT